MSQASQSQPRNSTGKPSDLSQVSQSQARESTTENPGGASQMSQSQPEFPIEALPTRVLLFVLEVSEALVVDPAIVAAPCLATLAGCIGNRRRIVVNPGSWTEPAILWIVLVLRSGGKKTPTLNAVLEHLHTLEAAEIEAEKTRRAEYDEQYEEWKAADKKTRGEKPDKPEPARRLLVSDVTTEGLLAVHTRAPLGLLLHRDELGGWLRSFNQYKAGGRGGDAQTWCEMHQGHPALIDRKGSATLSVPRASVSIIGGIQPELLREALSGEHLVDGIASRLLFVAPEEAVKTWSEETISEESRKGWTDLIDELLALQPCVGGEPVDLPMTDEAKAAWVTYYEDHAQREAEADGPLRSALSKLEAATARFALVIQLAEDPKSREVGVEAMEAGITISEWFENQARRVYCAAEAKEKEQERQELCDWIADQGGLTTKRKLTRLGPYKFRKRAGEVLEDLVDAGRAKRQRRVGKKAGQYVLCNRDLAEGEGQ